MIDMPHVVSVEVAKRSTNYSNCPLKKRPIKYELMDESDSDHSNNGSSPSPMEISEPENLSTKPEDLRLTLKPEQISPPPIGLVAGRGELPSPTSYLGNTYGSQLYAPQYSPGSSCLPIPEPPLLKFLPSSGGGPLEPISLNPPAVWPRVSPFSAFNFANGIIPNVNRSQPPNYSRHHQNHQHQNEHQNMYTTVNNFSKGSNLSPVIRSQSHHYPIQSSQYAPFANSHGEPGSPPHISPPLKTEPSYPLIKQEIHHRNGMDQIRSNIHEVSKSPQIKREVTLGNYQPLSRESVISHNYGVHHGHGHSHGSCSSGVSSPTSSTSSGSCSNGLPPLPTPTNGGSVRYQCQDCSKSYSTFSGLTKHVQFHCSSQNKKSFICKFCEKVYVSLGALKMHIRTHTLPCKCHHCGKAFSRPWLLQGHIRTHTGEKPFACQHCNRAFADRSNLRAHLQTHSEVKKYSCKACSKTFSRMSLLVKHNDSGCSSTLSD